MPAKILQLLSMRSTWVLIAALANAGGLYVNPDAVSAAAELANAAAKNLAQQETCAAPWTTSH